jgi:hypothetical protein
MKSRRDIIEAISNTIIRTRDIKIQLEEDFKNSKINEVFFFVETVYINNEISRLEDLRLEKLSEYDKLEMELYNA